LFFSSDCTGQSYISAYFDLPPDATILSNPSDYSSLLGAPISSESNIICPAKPFANIQVTAAKLYVYSNHCFFCATFAAPEPVYGGKTTTAHAASLGFTPPFSRQ
jgi:hypothetical protein